MTRERELFASCFTDFPVSSWRGASTLTVLLLRSVLLSPMSRTLGGGCRKFFRSRDICANEQDDVRQKDMATLIPVDRNARIRFIPRYGFAITDELLMTVELLP